MRHLILIVFLFVAQLACAQTVDDTLQQSEPFIKKSSLIALPLAFFTPETRWGGGGAALLSFRFRGNDETTRPSQLQLGLAYTQEKQILSYLPFQLYADQERWYVTGELGYYEYIYQFFGVGNETLRSNQEAFTAKFPRVQLNVMRLIQPNWYLGGRFYIDDYKVSGIKEAGLLSGGTIVGSEGGRVVGIGLISTLDTRDRIFYPSKGHFIQFTATQNAEFLGADLGFSRLAIDAAKYIAVGKKGVFATNIFVDLTNGDVPFQRLALIGGSKKLRGFFEGRFRDEKLWIVQTEYRQHIWKFIGITAFAGVGSVAPNVAAFEKSKVHYAGGLGLRIQLSKKDLINARVDVGINEEGNFFPYITVGEAF